MASTPPHLRAGAHAMSWRLRPAGPADAAELSALAERTFRDTFATLNTAEDMDLHCASSYSPARQAAEIDDADMETVVAEAEGRLVAFAQVHRRAEPPASLPPCRSIELRRFYVERGFHGTGLADALMARVFEGARAAGAEAVWLGVFEQNPRAIRFYERCGYAAVGSQVFVVGSDPQRDLVMLRRLGATEVPA